MRTTFEKIKEHLDGQPLVGVEVGVAEGNNFIEFLYGLPNIQTLYLVDNYSLDKRHKSKMLQRVLEHNNGRGYNRLIFYEENSVDAAKRFKDESLDFVYIDACHELEYVRQDIVAWYPKVKKGGILGGHDYSEYVDGVIQAVDYFISQGWDIHTDWNKKGNSSNNVYNKDWWMTKT